MADGVEISLEPSPATLHGLTRRELGDHTDTLPVLMETANPSHGRLRGVTNEEFVARHLTGIHYLCEEDNTLYGEVLTINGIPSYDELLNGSLSDYLN